VFDFKWRRGGRHVFDVDAWMLSIAVIRAMFIHNCGEHDHRSQRKREVEGLGIGKPTYDDKDEEGKHEGFQWGAESFFT
jgi:hypothetical protein